MRFPVRRRPAHGEVEPTRKFSGAPAAGVARPEMDESALRASGGHFAEGEVALGRGSRALAPLMEEWRMLIRLSHFSRVPEVE